MANSEQNLKARRAKALLQQSIRAAQDLKAHEISAARNWAERQLVIAKVTAAHGRG